MLVIVGLGNPGEKYKKTRHNAGFMVLDSLAKELKTDFVLSEKFKSEIAEKTLTFEGKKGKTRLLLVKPQTFMNNSGEAVAKIVKFYKLRPKDQVWVVHDDLDIDINNVRIRLNGSSAGQKGVQSIIDNLRTDSFVRFRFGIKSEKNNNEPAESCVLKRFSINEKKIVEEKIKKLTSSILALAEKGIKNTTI